METPVNIDARELAGMAGHWLGTGPNGYLGQGYGSDIKSILQSPMAAGLVDGQIAKLNADVPLTRAASVNVYSYDESFEQKVIVFEVAGQVIQAGST